MMTQLNEEINRIKNLLDGVLPVLKSLDEGNFYFNLHCAVQKMEEINILKKNLKKIYSPFILKKFDAELFKTAKQIQETFDNIVKEKDKQLTNVSSKIMSAKNQIKLANYYR